MHKSANASSHMADTPDSLRAHKIGSTQLRYRIHVSITMLLYHTCMVRVLLQTLRGRQRGSKRNNESLCSCVILEPSQSKVK